MSNSSQLSVLSVSSQFPSSRSSVMRRQLTAGNGELEADSCRPRILGWQRTRRRRRSPSRRSRPRRRARSSPRSQRSIPTPTPSSIHERLRTAGRDDPLGAVHRRAGEPGHACALQALPRRQGARAGHDRGTRAADPVDRVLPRQVTVTPRHGDRGRRTPSRRSAADDGRAGRSCQASAARPQTSSWPRARRARDCRSTAMSCASPDASGSPAPRIPRSSSNNSAPRCHRRTGPARLTRSSSTAAASANRSHSAPNAPSARLPYYRNVVVEVREAR